MYLRGKAIGTEHKKKGVHISLGPSVGPIGSKAAGGRNWESFGADPYLQGSAAAATIEGMQDAGVVAVVRHFVGYEQEHFRQVGEWEENGWDELCSSISSNIGDRAMHEVYMWPFAEAVRAGVGGVMCSYNAVNNTNACENSYVLNYLLKEEMAFQGFVVSDWGAQHSGVYSALAGLDLSMPGEVSDSWLSGRSYWGPLLTRAIYNQTLPQERLNDMVIRILVPFLACNSIDFPSEDTLPNFSSWTHHTYGQALPYQHAGPIVQQNWHIEARSKLSDKVALNVAREAIVLLKNCGQNLPVSRTDGVRNIFIGGNGAGLDPNGFNCKDQKCVQGTMSSGWGSAAVNNPFIVTPYEALSEKAKAQGMTVNFASATDDLDQVEHFSSIADLAIVVVQAHSGEGYIEIDGNYGDRKNLTLWHEGEKLIAAVADRCQKTVVIVNAVGPVHMEEWVDHENVVAILYAAPLGQFVGQAIADVIFGDVNPSGRLPFTIGRKLLHYVPIIETLGATTKPQDNFDRDIYLDYRFFDKHTIKPRYEFGYGLSYTSFAVSEMLIKEISPPTEYLPYAEEYLSPFHTILDDVCDPEDALFPHEDFHAQPGYIYPYLYNENLRNTDGDEKFDYPFGYSQDVKHSPPLSGGGMGGNPALWEVLYEVTAKVQNLGKCQGAYVAQLYLELPSTLASSPHRMLRGFDKVILDPDECANVNFKLTRKDMSIWDAPSQQWILQTGTYIVYISASSRQIEVSGEIDIGC